MSGDTGLAKRTLKLYVQLVSKAWETRDAITTNEDEDDDERKVPKEAKTKRVFKRTRTKDSERSIDRLLSLAAEHTSTPPSSSNGHALDSSSTPPASSLLPQQEIYSLQEAHWRLLESKSQPEEEEEENLINWIETLVFGARMLCRAALREVGGPAEVPSSASTSSSSSTAAPSTTTTAGTGHRSTGSISGGLPDPSAVLAGGLHGGVAGEGALEARRDVREAGRLVERARKALVQVKKDLVERLQRRREKADGQDRSGDDEDGDEDEVILGNEEDEVKALEASVELADGIYWSVLAVVGESPPLF